jgi:CubicO group peptidase (beta-lactamase class C family)
VATKSRLRNLLILFAIGAGLIPIAVLGLFAYKTATKRLLHASPDSLPSEIRAAPKPEWAGAVGRAQAAARAGIFDQNLPGISVAVGVGGDLVWAEGFGWADLEEKVPVAPDTRFRIGTASIALTSAAAAGEPISRFMRDQVFDPLEMRDTKFESAPKSIANLATSYFPSFAEDNRYGPDVMRPIHLSCFAGAGGFASTASDLVRFATAVESGKLLKPETVRWLQTSQRLPSGETTGYGLGWDLETAAISGKSTTVVGHDGNLLGSRAVSLMTFPEHGIVVAVLSNTSHSDTFDIAVKIAEAFAGKGKTP